MLSAVDAIAASIEAAASMSRTGPVRAEPVDLGRVVDDAWLTLEPTAQQRGLSLDNRIAAGTVVRADRHALLTIVRNLLRNAAEHAAPARCTVDADAGALCIEDDGPGIPAELLPRIFERAWRGPRADTATPEDPDRPERGLGLAIARRLAELNGWSLAAEAATPRGVRFVLRFAPER
jgi:signal transduction histidine kinase